jgi:hypothetical protein
LIVRPKLPLALTGFLANAGDDLPPRGGGVLRRFPKERKKALWRILDAKMAGDGMLGAENWQPRTGCGRLVAESWLPRTGSRELVADDLLPRAGCRELVAEDLPLKTSL